MLISWLMAVSVALMLFWLPGLSTCHRSRFVVASEGTVHGTGRSSVCYEMIAVQFAVQNERTHEADGSVRMAV